MRETRQDDAERDVRLAWQTVALWHATRANGRVPDLKELTRRLRGTGRASMTELVSALKTLSKQYGTPLRTLGAHVDHTSDTPP